MANTIKNILADGTLYEIEALHFYISSSLDSPAQWKKYIDDQVATAAKIRLKTVGSTGSPKYEPVDPDVSGTQPNADNMGLIYLVSDGAPESGTYVEWVAVNTSGSTYVWERIGTTQTDLSEYALKADVNASLQATTNTDPSATTSTGSAGGATLTTSQAGGTLATGTGYVAKTITTSEAGNFTLQGSNFGFTGQQVTLQPKLKIDKHSYTPEGDIGGSYTVNGHTHGITSSGTTVIQTITPATTNVVTNVGQNGTISAVTGVTSGSTPVFVGATVTGETLSFVTANALNTISVSGSATVLTGVTVSSTTPAVTGISAVTTSVLTSVSTQSAGGTVIQGSSFNFTGKVATLTHTQAAAQSSDYDMLTGTNVTFTPAGSITGSQTVGTHAHSITPSTVAAFDVKVNVLDHAHTVTVTAHTHSLQNHTHGVTFTGI